MEDAVVKRPRPQVLGMSMRRIVLCLAISLVPTVTLAADLPLPAAIQSGFRIRGASHSIKAIGTDANGNIYISGQFFGAILLNSGFPVATKTILGPKTSPASLFVAKISPSGQELLYLTEIHDPDPSYNMLGAMAVAPDGSVILAGATRDAEFPTTDGAFQPRSANGGAFLLKLDPFGQKLVFSTYLDDSSETGANSLHVDAAGNCHVAGSTDGRTFPTTPAAYQPRPSTAGQRPRRVGFVSKISADGKNLLSSTLFTESVVDAMAVDAAGRIHLAGSTLLAVLDPAGSRLVYSREFPDTNRIPLLGVDRDGNSYLAFGYYYSSDVKKFDASGTLVYDVQVPGADVRALLVADDDTVFAGGAAVSVGFPTRDTLQPCNMNLPHDYIPVQWWVMSGAFIVLDPTGRISHASFLGGSAPSGYGNDVNSVAALARGRDGSVYLAGTTASPEFPGGATLISGSGTASTFGLRLDLGAVDRGRPSAACLANAAWAEAPVMPAALMTIFGSNLGPAGGVSFNLDSDNRVPIELAGMRVTVGGLEAPVLYVQDQQINFIVPQAVAGTTTNVCVVGKEAESCLFGYVGDVSPGVFRVGKGYAVLNAAADGSVISLFGTGFGPFDRSPPDGSLASSPLGRLVYTVRAQFWRATTSRYAPPGPFVGEVLYAGAAPGLVHGVVQLNIRVPKDLLLGSTTVQLLVDGGTVPQYRPPLMVPLSVK
jgi:uncharacterized protein (TIGR03437 family)